MRFENSFDVGAPIEEVCETLLDLERVAPCVPGAEVLEKTGDNAYKVAIKVKVGPMSMQYKGDVEVTETDDAAHRATMGVKAREARGQGTANADVGMHLTEESGRTRGTIQTDVQLSGRVASMGRGIIQDVSAKIVDQFAGNLAAMLERSDAPAAAPADGPSGNGAAAEPQPAASEPATATQEAPAPAADAELSAVGLAGAVVAGRLKDRKTQGVLVAALGILVLLLVRRATR